MDRYLRALDLTETTLVQARVVEVRLFPRPQLTEGPTSTLAGPLQLPADLLRQNYQGELVGQELWQGRQADVIALLPMFSGNPSRRVWVDQESGLPLRAESYDSSGRLFQLVYVLDLMVLGPAPPPPPPQLGSEPVVDLNYLPPGYVLLGTLGDGRRQRQVYTDGLNVLVLAVRPAPSFGDQLAQLFRFGPRRRPPFGPGRRGHGGGEVQEIIIGEPAAEGRFLSRRLGDFELFLIGSHDPAQLQAMLDSAMLSGG